MGGPGEDPKGRNESEGEGTGEIERAIRTEGVSSRSGGKVQSKEDESELMVANPGKHEAGEAGRCTRCVGGADTTKRKETHG